MQNPYKFRHWEIPEYMHQGMEDYIKYGTPPGDFLSNIIQNKFVEAVFHADNKNLRNIQAYAHWLYWEVPSVAWGNNEKFKIWISHKGLSGYDEYRMKKRGGDSSDG